MAGLEVVTNNLMVLGGGLMQSEPGAPLELRTTARVDRAGQYFQDHRDAFLGEGALILCSGGGSPIYDEVDPATIDVSEASLSFDRLMNEWGVPSNILACEETSNTTTMNLVESIESAFITPSAYSSGNPLGVVTHKNHYWRAQADFRDAGFAKGSTIGIHPEGKDPAVSDSFAKEVVSRMVRAAFFRGVRPGDLDELRARNDRLVQAMAGGPGSVIRGMASAIQNKRQN